ncbi:hypothetical protein KHP60_09725 [Microvirga sp. 3-52]|uniref:hypothetical protein n=1 Tax=Microvirga sp. 3-52 TaxID=2792425 RepID=UPI001ACF8E72|nr:hypothetical protein [Microvirga sp. 3-52]MBO1905298.1 hypothetical protein [Microvirga sp. 3-52]MBS7452613.1 hypothetical protein [Microvirga sp. 3-52]
MARESVVPLIVSVLEPHLERLHSEWLASDGLRPSLPAVGEKVNVRQLVRDLGQVDERVLLSHEQHFYRKPELMLLVNKVAEEQGLSPIGSRSPDEADDAARRRIGKLSGEASELRQLLAERDAAIEALRRDNAVLREQLRLLEETGMVMRLGDAR